MSTSITLEEIRYLHQRCLDLLSEVPPKPNEAEHGVSVRAADGTLIEIIAWKVVVPILTAITGGIVARVTGDVLQERRDRKALKKEAEAYAGETRIAINEQQLLEGKVHVASLLVPFGVTIERVDFIVRELVSASRAEKQDDAATRDDPPT